MDSNAKTTILTVATALGTVLAALALHGQAALTALAGVPAFLSAWTSGLPLGVWSFCLSVLLAMLVWLVAAARLQKTALGRIPHFSADTLAFCVAMIVTLSQQATVGPPRPGVLLNAFYLGAIAGLGAPYLGRGLRALFVKRPKESPTP